MLILGPNMMFSLIVMVLMVLTIIAILPIWPYSRGWGYQNSGALSLITLVVLINYALTHYVI